MNGHWRAFSPQNISCPTHTTYIPIHFFTFTVKPDILGPSNEIITLLFTVKPDILGAWRLISLHHKGKPVQNFTVKPDILANHWPRIFTGIPDILGTFLP